MPMNNGFTGATLYGAASAVETTCDAQVTRHLLVHDLDALAAVESQRLGNGRSQVEDAPPGARLGGADLHPPVAARQDGPERAPVEHFAHREPLGSRIV